MKYILLLAAALGSAVIGTDGHLELAGLDKVVKELSSEEVLRSVLLGAEEISVDGCQCVEYNCGCCGRIVVKKVKFDETICVNASYLPKEYGIRVTLTLNDFVLLNQSISAKNPPPLCAGVPHVKELSLCIRFYNLSIGNFSFAGCVDLEAHILHIIEEKYDLGCFKVGNATKLNVMAEFAKLDQKTYGSEWKNNPRPLHSKLRNDMKLGKKVE